MIASPAGAAPVAEASAAVVAPQLGPPKSLLYAAIRILDTVCFTSLAAIETLVSIGLGPVATVLEHHESQRIRMQGLKLVATMARCAQAVMIQTILLLGIAVWPGWWRAAVASLALVAGSRMGGGGATTSR